LAKQRARRSAAGWGNIVVVPTAERLRHGAVEQLGRQIADSAGAIGRPFRAVDTLAAMERRGTITAGMRQAGEQLRNLFRVAHLDPLHAASLVRVSTATGGDDPNNRVLAAKERLWRAICAVGGLASPGGACLWHVIGLEQTLKEWALITGSSRGRPVAQETASGILVGALGVLETHFGVRIE
jgi:hypothetical protein